MIYFDTSYIVRLYFQDPGAETVRALAATDHVACAALGQAEVFAALHRKLREGAIRKAAYSALVEQVTTHMEAGAFQWLGQDDGTLLRVREIYEHLPASVYLRGADAIHLATAAQAGLTVVYSNDAHLLAAAKYFSIQGKNVLGHDA